MNTTQMTEEVMDHHATIADFYDRRVDNLYDLNTCLACEGKPVHHHAGIVRVDEPVPEGDQDALAWLYACEQSLCDFVWHVIQKLSQRSPHRLLDAGCGEGGTVARFYELGPTLGLDIVGITLSEKQGSAARKVSPQATFLVGDMLSEPTLWEHEFDVVYGIESTEYLGPANVRAFMENAVAWLAPRGLLVIVAGSRSPDLAPDDELVRTFDFHYQTRLSSTEHYRRFARNAGLDVAAEINLLPVTLPYWRVRRDRAVLNNSQDGMVERRIVKAMERGLGEYRLYAWYRGG